MGIAPDKNPLSYIRHKSIAHNFNERPSFKIVARKISKSSAMQSLQLIKPQRTFSNLRLSPHTKNNTVQLKTNLEQVALQSHFE